MKYWEKAYQHLQKYGKITTIEIIDLTDTTCPHSIIRDLKKHGAEFRTEDGVSKDGKKFRTYFLTKPITEKQKNTIEPPKEDFTTVSQLNFGLIVEKTKMSALEIRKLYGNG